MKRLELKQLTAHDKILIFDNLRYLLEGLEEYIEKAGFYPNFKYRRQLRNITIPKQQADNLTADSAEDFFKTNLILYVSMVDQAPPSEKEKLVQEYYKWINSVGINPDNCPQKLKNFLIEIKNVLEGNSEKVIQQTKEYLDSKDEGNAYPTNPQDTLTLFGLIQKPLNKERERAKSYEGKSYSDVEITNRFSGDVKKGEQTFGRISGSTSDYDSFHLYSQQSGQKIRNPNYRPFVDDLSEEFISSSSQAASSTQGLDDFQYARRILIDDIKQRANEFEFKQVLTSTGKYWDNINKKWVSHDKEKWENMLVHKSIQITGNDYNEFGYLRVQTDKMFQESRFSREEWTEIQVAVNNVRQNQTAYYNKIQNQTDNNRKGGGSSGWGLYGWGSITVISLIGLIFTR